MIYLNTLLAESKLKLKLPSGIKKLHKLFNNEINTYEDLKNFDIKYNFIKSMIKFENIDKNILNVFNQANITVDKKKIFEKNPVNLSRRLRNAMDYYDDETIKLVHQNDQLIFEKYKY